MEREILELYEEMEKTKKCLKKRSIKHCDQCCRCKECYGEAPQNFPNVGVEKIVGAMIWQALEDLDTKIPPLKECKTKSQKERRERLLYEKASAENFFKSRLFKTTNLDLGYLRRAYEKAKIHQSRY